MAMFDTPAQAETFLLGRFEPAFVEEVVSALAPALVLTGGASGLSRLGGAPLVPEGFRWPVPPKPADPQAIAARGNADAAAIMLDHIEREVPYAFIAQVELSEVSNLPGSADLPDAGRLLFFYDLAVGPWDTGTRTARVIHDTSPAQALKSAEVPDVLAAADEEERRQGAEDAERLRAEFGENVGTGEGLGTVYMTAGRAVCVESMFQAPDPSSIEIARLPRLEAAASGASADAADMRLLQAYQYALAERSEENWTPETGSVAGTHQLLGVPRPEQDDPRYDAVVVTEHGTQHLTREAWDLHRDDVFAKAREWRLLFQFDVGAWQEDDLGTGTVYYLIRDDDLRERRFDGVVAVYQQT